MVTWQTILSECDDADQGYRQRIVAIFRKYEGQATDERDGSNRVVKVTASSFAAHMGIAEKTFHQWVKGRPAPKVPAHRAVTPEPAPNPAPRPAPRPVDVDPNHVPPIEIPNPGDEEDIVDVFNREVAERRQRLGLPVEAPVTELLEGQLGALTAFYHVNEALKDAEASVNKVPELVAGHIFSDDVRDLMCERADGLIAAIQMLLEQLRNPLSIDDFFNA